MAKFTSTRLKRDASYGSSGERSFRKALRNKRSSVGLQKYLSKRGKKGYSTKSFKKWLRQERIKDRGSAIGVVGEKKMMTYLDKYGKEPSRAEMTKAVPASDVFSKSSLPRTASKLKRASEQREMRRLNQKKRQFKEEFSTGSHFSDASREASGGIQLDPLTGALAPRDRAGARPAPDFARSARNLRPRP